MYLIFQIKHNTDYNIFAYKEGNNRQELVYAENVLKDSDDKLYNNSYSYNY